MRILCLSFFFISQAVIAQPNCTIYSGPCRTACELYLKTERFNQGTFRANELYDSAISLCPEFSFAHHEKSVGYLKNGEFLLWRQHMDEAVRLAPAMFLGNRGWCRFKFLRDYRGAITDILELRRINNGVIGWSNDGDYDLRIVLALCYREINDMNLAFREFEQYFDSKKKDPGGLALGSYDYLHYGVTLLRAGKVKDAQSAFQEQIKVYRQLPDTYYYLATIHRDNGDHIAAAENATLAQKFYQQGFNRKDPYCEALDEVYPTDLERLVTSLK
jgi:tetratricopeptide (TPR) repeat protein